MTIKALGEQLISIDPKTKEEVHWYGGSSMQVWYAVLCFLFYSLPVNAVTSRCASHIIHLATKHCINTIYPIPALKQNKSTVGAAPVDDDEPWEAGDLLGKVLALVKQVHAIHSIMFLGFSFFFYSDSTLSPSNGIPRGVLCH